MHSPSRPRNSAPSHLVYLVIMDHPCYDTGDAYTRHNPQRQESRTSKLGPNPDHLCYFLKISWGGAPPWRHAHEPASVSRMACLLLHKPVLSICGFLAKSSLQAEFWEWTVLPGTLECLPKQLKKPQLPGAREPECSYPH